MQDQGLFEYAVIRVVPKVEREEFFNVGVILFAKKKKFLGIRYALDPRKLEAFNAAVESEDIEQYLKGFEHICQGAASGGPIAKLDQPSRFRWLTAARSTIIQCSKVHPGFCNDPAEALEKLFQSLVG
ncbi:DUF3037 domain-containing protein [Flavihumibacter rivuli]|uniref:DUF3037 domain-containing protein n=1 Tax=Flavihumibacter rivuli TaxID=2838156 RepID=UPI001BDDE9AB|nr:DUF3037 domain-containing protein [Flavihumibacter rivuli]ULQ57592.1 DUF3037 domain-containing protein [Flavihumibacter rivuli]